jgi:hypothetical protein
MFADQDQGSWQPLLIDQMSGDHHSVMTDSGDCVCCAVLCCAVLCCAVLCCATAKLAGLYGASLRNQ